MALYFACNGLPANDPNLKVSVNDKKSIDLMKAFSRDIFAIQADGDELVCIRKHFSNIPVAHENVVVWIGDTAKFIAINFPYTFQK